ncbi:uncharacterized protein LOC133990155, partial [Scomber scombrus]|uniref:uncharacterized protein LOC133990155 n=1 Tax=Scomber scombrus TaxID=13677 RepID=UPI002DD9750E
MLLHFIWMMMLTFHTGSSEDLLKPLQDVMLALEGDNVTLSCNYSGSVNYLYWYQQKSSSAPHLLIMEYQETVEGFSLKHDEQAKIFQLQISSAAVTDSAVYYCALQPTVARVQVAFASPHGPSLRIQSHLEAFSAASVMFLIALLLAPPVMPSTPRALWTDSELLNTADMTSLFISVLLAAMCLECRAQQDNVLQPKGDLTATEGQTVTLGCQYNTSSTNHYLFWYKQDGNNRPKFILSRFKVGEGKTEDEFKERFSSTLDSTSRSVPLNIQKLQLSDSAVYYCAL